MSAPFPRSRGIDESLADYHNAFFREMLSACRNAGLDVTLEPDRELGQKLMLDEKKYVSLPEQERAAKKVRAIYQRLSGANTKMVYVAPGSSTDD